MVERLILSRFRGIRKGVIKDMGRINLLVGPNNSGKTAILEALYWLSVSGRECVLDADLSELKDEDGLSIRGRDAFVPIEEDILGFSPCPRIWKRHGKLESWKYAPGSVSEDGIMSYRIPHLKEPCLFRWSNVPGNDSKRLLSVLKDDLDVDWAKSAEICKSDDGKTIRIHKDENSAEIEIIPSEKTDGKATLKISDGRTRNLKVKRESGEPITYDERLKTFRLIPPPTEEFIDTAKFDENTLSKTGVFVMDDPKSMSDVLAHYLPDLYPDEFSSDGNVHRRFAFTWYPDFIHWRKSLGVWGAEGPVADADCVLFFDFHATGDQFRPAFGSAIHNVIDWRDQLTGLFGAVFDNAVGTDDFRVEIGQLHLPSPLIEGAVEIKGKGTIPIDDFGDGARHAFKVLAGLVLLADRCKEGREGIFLWEDPELFMHSKSLCRLVREVLELVKDKPIQVFISTQSLDVLACMAKMMEDGICGEDDVRTYRLSLNDGLLDVTKFRGGALNNWLRSGHDPRIVDISEDDNVLVWHLEAEDEGELLW